MKLLYIAPTAYGTNGRCTLSGGYGYYEKLNGSITQLQQYNANLFTSHTFKLRFITANPAVNQIGGWLYLNEPRIVRLNYTRNFGIQAGKAANKRATGSDEERGWVQANQYVVTELFPIKYPALPAPISTFPSTT